MAKTRHDDYGAFVDKFKPKKTTDDCYTPDYIYDAVLGWLKNNADIAGKEIVRPFWPGGDYRTANYPENCVVVDNPPFSILAEIKRWYQERNIRYFLFAPHLTLFSSCRTEQTFIVANASIIYENGANVNTDFVTNLAEFSQYGIIGEPNLKREIEEAQRKARQGERGKEKNPGYIYPDNLVTVSSIAYIINGGVEVKIPKDEIVFTRRLDAQIPTGKAVYGGAFLCSDRVAVRLKSAKFESDKLKEKRLEEKRLEEKKLKERYRFELSENERNIIAQLNKNL